ncbi:MAG TPA: alanine--tRNA ligase [Puia sp.]|jgi:alanyl-tRNA synthetase|nr:alanine--tRNA ligase [Puia sp.]
MMTSAEIRKKFLDFFVSKGHTIVPSAPIVIKNDPTLKFTNAGMNQFKDYFLGNRKAPYPRVCDTQKCLRVSGKHNDLEEVGVDTYHHTMFEMLGNWSFGDPANPAAGYFKKEAIGWSWELLTEVYGIPKDRLYVTVFEGDPGEGLLADKESSEEWSKWIGAERILPGKKKDNFWEMGDTGPCGPCTEIHVDCRTDAERLLINGAALVNNDHPQVIEIWNDVFIEFNRLKDGSLQPLPARHVDTGMGFERLVRVLQGKHSNYDTDLFMGTIAAIGKIVRKAYAADDSKASVAFRVIADHIRAISFTIADGQLPSNTDAGYVIRRILRRAVRYYYSYLDYKQPLLFQLVPVVAGQFKDVFPELHQQADFISKVVKEEEEAFLRTLEKGLKKIDEFFQEIRDLRQKNGLPEYKMYSDDPDSIDKGSNELYPFDFSGKLAFELYDTYGFPFDLTKLILSQNSIGFDFKIDEKSFDMEMQRQKTRSRAATALDTEDWIVLIDNPLTEFVGYDMLEINSKVVKYRKIKTKGKESWQLVLEATPFYAESGGQVGDTGILQFDQEIVEVTDTKKENDLIVHFTDKIPLNIDTEVIAKVNPDKRKAIEAHHSATHLLHAALRKVIGTHVAQKGSLVNEEHLRFDFSSSTVSDDELKKVETIVNEKIRENIPIVIKEMHKDEAIKMGAMALFGEKYGNIVRVVIIDPNYSVELCGGTHVGRTGDLGFFIITQETAIAAGVRRIEAKAAKAAFEYLHEYLVDPFEKIKKITKRKSKDAPIAVEGFIAEISELKKSLEKMELRQLKDIYTKLLGKVQLINGVSFIGEIVDVDNVEALKKLCFDLKNELKDYVVVLAANIGGKANVAVLLDEKVTETRNLQAPTIVKEHIAPLIRGGGGGQKTLATAGGQDASNLPQVIERVKSLLKN